MKIHTIGRSLKADVCISQSAEVASVSDYHADITASPDGTKFHVVDRGSTNGTFVWNGKTWEKITQRVVLPDTPLSFGRFRASAKQLLRQ